MWTRNFFGNELIAFSRNHSGNGPWPVGEGYREDFTPPNRYLESRNERECEVLCEPQTRNGS